jgi:DNA uptake protein ComE-like DNA-binding protein
MRKILQALVIALAALGLAAGSAMAQKADAKKEAPKAEAKKEAAAAPKAEPMDINSASEKDLATLPGIGEKYSAAIVKHRPYKGKDDLVHKKVIPQKTYDGIKDMIIAKQDTAKAAEPKKDAKKK